MKLDEILRIAGKHKARKRVGRGIGSGHGKTSCRGHKGAGARAGAKRRWGYEGGQNPVFSRIPKRGFSNANFRSEYQIVNIAALEVFEPGTRVDAAALAAARIIRYADVPLKVLGKGDLSKKLTVIAWKVSASAAEKIAKVGGTVELA